MTRNLSFILLIYKISPFGRNDNDKVEMKILQLCKGFRAPDFGIRRSMVNHFFDFFAFAFALAFTFALGLAAGLGFTAAFFLSSTAA